MNSAAVREDGQAWTRIAAWSRPVVEPRAPTDRARDTCARSHVASRCWPVRFSPERTGGIRHAAIADPDAGDRPDRATAQATHERQYARPVTHCLAAAASARRCPAPEIAPAAVADQQVRAAPETTPAAAESHRAPPALASRRGSAWDHQAARDHADPQDRGT